MTFAEGIVNVNEPEIVASVAPEYNAFRVPDLSCFPASGLIVNVIVAPATEGEVAIPIVLEPAFVNVPIVIV